MRRCFAELVPFQLCFCWNGFTGTGALSSAAVPAPQQSSWQSTYSNADGWCASYSASVGMWISSVVSHLFDKYKSQNSAPFPWTISGFYIYLGINLEWVEAVTELTIFHGPESEDSSGIWEISVQVVWIKVAFPTLWMEELSVYASNYSILSNLFSNVKSIQYMLFFLLPVWLVISFSSSLWTSKTTFCFSF